MYTQAGVRMYTSDWSMFLAQQQVRVPPAAVARLGRRTEPTLSPLGRRAAEQRVGGEREVVVRHDGFRHRS